jgi:hypothetical protein
LIIPHCEEMAKLGSSQAKLSSGILWHSAHMARTKKKKHFRAVSAVKALARERIGTPPPEQVAPNRKKKAKSEEKHKPTLGKMLGGDE